MEIATSAEFSDKTSAQLVFFQLVSSVKLGHKMLQLSWCSFWLQKINQGRWENWPRPQNKGERSTRRHSVQPSISLRLLPTSSHRAVLTPSEQFWNTQMKLHQSVQARAGSCGGWEGKFYIINNQYLWLHITLTPEATDDRLLLSAPRLGFFSGRVPSPQPSSQVDRSGSQSREKLHEQSIRSKHTSMSKQLLILFVKSTVDPSGSSS